jgi:iron(III) transport system permease protein
VSAAPRDEPGPPRPTASSALIPPPSRRGHRGTAPGVATLTLVLLALLLWSVVYPNVSIIVGSFAGGLVSWREFFASPGDMDALRGTVIVSIGSVIAALLIGVPLAFLLTRAEFRGRRLLGGVATLPAALPPLVGVLAFLFLYGESGVVTRVVQRAFGLAAPPWTLQGLPAVIFVHAYTMYVYVFLFVSAGLERYDTTLDEAAQGLGASRGLLLRRVTLPLLTPSLVGAMLLVFMSALGSFSAPYVFGGGARVLATQILVSRLNGSLGLAYVETTVLAVTAVIALLVLRRLEGRRQYTMAGKGRATRGALGSGVARMLVPPLAIALVVLLVLPHLMVVLISFARDGAWTTQLLPPEYTMDNYRTLATDPALWRPITNSVGMSAVATIANAIVCFAIAYVVVLSKARGRRMLALVAALPWAIPATAIALGLAATFDRNAPLQLRVLLVGTFWILPFAYFIRNIPLVTSAIEGSLRQMDPTLEDAARGLGASRWMALRRVILPAARPGLIAGTMLAAVAAVGEFVASVVLYTHANRPISVEILAQVRSLSFGTAAAYSVLLIALVLAITVGARWLEGIGTTTRVSGS